MARRPAKLKDELAALDREVNEDRSAVRRIHKWIPIGGTVVALVGFGVVTWYAYNQGILEGSEEAAPYLRPSGVLKARPVNPGGQVPNRGKLVYNILEPREDDGQVERLLPPSEEPKELPRTQHSNENKLPSPPISNKDDDTSDPKITETLSPRTAKQTLKQALDLAEQGAPPPLPPPSVRQEGKVKDDLVGGFKNGPYDRPKGPIRLTPAQKPILGQVTQVGPSLPTSDQKVKSVSKVTGSTTPISGRPKLLKRTSPKKSALPIRQQGGKGYYIQLGALRSEISAKRAWSIARKKHPTLLRRQTLNVQRVAIVNKGVYYRVQSGPFVNAAEAKKLCNALKRRKQSCIIAQRR